MEPLAKVIVLKDPSPWSDVTKEVLKVGLPGMPGKWLLDKWNEPKLQLVDPADRRLGELTVLVHSRFEKGVAYVQHPLAGNAYLPMAGFHNYLQDEKLAEFLRVMRHLGARCISIVENRTSREEKKGTLKAKGAGGSAAIDGSQEHDRHEMFRIEQHFSKPTTLPSPALPNGLRWYRHEPTWKMTADARLQADLMKTKVMISYNDDYGVKAGVALRIARTGIELGGSFTKARTGSQTYEIEFFEKP